MNTVNQTLPIVLGPAGIVLGLAEGLVGPVIPLCGTDLDPALPVTSVITGNGGSWFQLYQSRQTGWLYVSWRLNTNNIKNGADTWAFGIEIDNQGIPWASHVWYSDLTGNHNDGEFGECKPIVQLTPNQDYDYRVDAGAGGWSAQASCTLTFDWHMTVGVQIGLTGGAAGSTTFGGSLSCSLGGEWDSESLLRGTGTTMGTDCVPEVTC
jgi:hypothetical protein